MARQDIVRELSAILQDVTDTPAERVGESAAFVADLELDSLRMVQVVVAAEDRFGVTISDEDAWELRTVAEAVTYIERALRSAGRDVPSAPAAPGLGAGAGGWGA
ncbi:acyl carrier protein [Streptomyces sp. NPDC006711]|uniref:acyl carrier protein n=1 Tax=unclassified Streptomyces TaxID=2593676 RepID=UPI0033E6A713